MPSSVRQIIKDDDIVASASRPEAVAKILKGAWPGRYVIEESSMAGETLRSGYSRFARTMGASFLSRNQRQ